ncbi:hypothetical protein V6N12_024509 [Hibiscus sabdariffa]|uniref:RNase H type-1 domain-containing protein n=1 Tax=Hibiscus sabdariffa TaxID=183260 RepID=A0ABR2G0R3_9ROSI
MRDRLLPNESRYHMNHTDDPSCQLCGARSESSVHVLRDYLLHVSRTWAVQFHSSLSPSASNLIPSQSPILHWSLAPSGWLTLHTDGSVSTISSYGSAGGLIRDNEGSYLTRFTRHLGITTPLQAKLWAIHEGLLLAWSLGLERLQCQMDCAEGFNLITSSNANSISLTLVRVISCIASRAWMVDFCLIRRVANEAADSIPKIPTYFDGSTFIFSDAPPEISLCLLRDTLFVDNIS